MFKRIDLYFYVMVALSGTASAALDYQQVSDAVVNAGNIFADNFAERPVQDAQKEKWKKAVQQSDAYVKEQLAQKRSFGKTISDANKTAIEQGNNAVIGMSGKFFKTVEKFQEWKAAPNDADKARSFQDHINILNRDLKVIEEDQKKLAAKTGDVTDTTNMKDIVKKELLIIEVATKNFTKNAIDYAKKNFKVEISQK